MATMITSECINCGACEPECPNTAIYQGGVEWQAPDGAMHPALSERDLLHRAREVHRVRRLPRPRGVRGGVPGRLLRAQPGHPRDARRAAGARARRCTRTRRSPTTPRRASRRRTGRRPAEPAAAAAAGTRRPRRRRRRRPPPGRCRPPRPPPVSPSRRSRTGRCRSTASGATGDYTVPFPTYRAGTVFRCPHCLGSFVPTLSMVRARRARRSSSFHATWTRDFERFHEQRRRELEQFEERQRGARRASSEELRGVAARERAPGAPSEAARVLVVLIGPGAGGGAAAASRVPARTARGRGAGRAARAGVHGPGPRSRVRHPVPRRPPRRRRALHASIPTARRWRARAHDDSGTAARRSASSSSSTSRRPAVARRRRHHGDRRGAGASSGRLVDTFATLVNPGRRDPAVRRRADRHHRRDGGDGAAASPRRCRASSPSRATPCWWRTTPASTWATSTPPIASSTGRALGRPALCTIRLARRLLPGAAPPLARRGRGDARHRLPRSPSRRSATRASRPRSCASSWSTPPSAASAPWASCWRFQQAASDGLPLRGPRAARAPRGAARGAGRVSSARRGRPAALRRQGAPAARAGREAGSPTRAATRGAPSS